jgi:hypothetical protein
MAFTPARSALSARAAALALLLALAGCQTPQRGGVTVSVEEPEPPRRQWSDVARADDIARLDRLAAAWEEGLGDARRAGFARAIAAEGALLDPAAALPRAAPPPGSYRCRVIKMGRARPRGRAFIAYNPFFCHVGAEGELLSITKQTGTQRPGGYLWPDGDARLIFIGSMALGNEDVPLPYGEDPRRDMIGAFERVDAFRWRLVIPWPRGDESKLDVFELVPHLPR